MLRQLCDRPVALTAASATFASKAGVGFRRGRLCIVSPDWRANLARRQAEAALIALFRFPEPALSDFSPARSSSPVRGASCWTAIRSAVAAAASIVGSAMRSYWESTIANL